MYIPSEIEARDLPAAVEQKIYSTHAASHDVNQLPNLLRKLNAILVDIRFAPPVQPLKWSRDYLKLLVKRKYLHVPTLGNRAAGEKIAIHNPALGIKIITELKVNILLFCSCENEENCHRRIIAREFRKRGREVIELADWV